MAWTTDEADRVVRLYTDLWQSPELGRSERHAFVESLGRFGCDRVCEVLLEWYEGSDPRPVASRSWRPNAAQILTSLVPPVANTYRPTPEADGKRYMSTQQLMRDHRPEWLPPKRH